MEHDNMQEAIFSLLMFVDEETGKYVTVSSTSSTAIEPGISWTRKINLFGMRGK